MAIASEYLGPYGEQAKKHYERFLPRSLAALPEAGRMAFFLELGQRIELEIVQEADAIAGAMELERPPGAPEETYQETVQRLETAKATAESQVIRERLTLDDRLPREIEDDPMRPLPEGTDPVSWMRADLPEDSEE
jgi:hypothetical protein